MFAQSFGKLAHLVVHRDDGSGQFAPLAFGSCAFGQAWRSLVVFGMDGFGGPVEKERLGLVALDEGDDIVPVIIGEPLVYTYPLALL